MKQYWDNLSSHEQRTIKWGAMAVVVLMLIRFIWWPLSSRIDQLNNDIENERELIAWMEPTVAVLKENAGQAQANQQLPRLSAIEKSFSKSGLSAYVKNLAQNDTNEIVVHVRDVPFATLAQCLESLGQEYNIEPLSFSATKKKPGIVDADVVF